MHQVPASVWNAIARHGQPRTDLFRTLMSMGRDEIDGALEAICDRLNQVTDSSSVCLAWCVLAPLLHENEAISRAVFAEGSDWRQALPEILSVEEALQYADGDYRLDSRGRQQLQALLTGPLPLLECEYVPIVSDAMTRALRLGRKRFREAVAYTLERISDGHGRLIAQLVRWRELQGCYIALSAAIPADEADAPAAVLDMRQDSVAQVPTPVSSGLCAVSERWRSWEVADWVLAHEDIWEGIDDHVESLADSVERPAELVAHLEAADVDGGFARAFDEWFGHLQQHHLLLAIEQGSDEQGLMLPADLRAFRLGIMPADFQHAYSVFLAQCPRHVRALLNHYVYWLVRFERIQRTGRAML